MADGHEVRTVEDLEQDGELDPVQQGFMNEHGLQCGFCTPGMMMTARGAAGPQPRSDARPRSARPSPASCAAAPATRTSCGRSGGPPSHPRPPQAATEAVAVMTTTSDREPRPQSASAAGSRKEDAAIPAGPRAVHRRREAARHAARRRAAKPLRARADPCRSTPRAAEAHPKVRAVITGALLETFEAWRGSRRFPMTSSPSWPRTRSASRARRWRSSSPRTATPRGTRSS